MTSNPTSADTSTSRTYVVNSSADVVDANDGVLTLREAIEAANAKPGADKIVINSDVNLSSSQGTLLITDDLTITGGRIQGSGALTDVFTVDNGADVTIENINISGGQDAIRVENGNVTVQNATLENNFDDGIDVVGSNNNLTVSNVLIRNNLDDGIDIGGNGNSVSLQNLTLSGNSENGLEVEGDNNSVDISRIAATENGDNGLAVVSDDNTAESNTLRISDSSFSDNFDDGVDIGGNNNNISANNVQASDNLDDGIDIGGNSNSFSLSNATLDGNSENGLEVEGDNNSVDISRIAATENGDNGLAVVSDDNTAESNTLRISDSSFSDNFDDGVDIGGNNNYFTASNIQASNNLDDGIDIGGNGNSFSLSNATLSGNTENGLEVEGDNNSLQISRIASINNGENGLELKDVADNNIVTLVNSTLANNAEGNLANTGSNNSLNITNVAGAPNSTGTVNIAILNPSFETPAFPTLQESFDDYFLAFLDSPTKEIPGWQAYDPQDLITGNPVPPSNYSTDGGSYNVAGFFLNGATDGANASYLDIYEGVGVGVLGLTQTLPDELTAYTTYTLQVDVGNPQNTPGYEVDLTGFPGYRVELLAGNQVIAADNNSLSIAEGSFGTSTVTYTTTANDPFLGENLGIRLINLNQTPGIEVNFDRISFTANYLI